jgi:hypothetical protein
MEIPKSDFLGRTWLQEHFLKALQFLNRPGVVVLRPEAEVACFSQESGLSPVAGCRRATVRRNSASKPAQQDARTSDRSHYRNAQINRLARLMSVAL